MVGEARIYLMYEIALHLARVLCLISTILVHLVQNISVMSARNSNLRCRYRRLNVLGSRIIGHDCVGVQIVQSLYSRRRLLELSQFVPLARVWKGE